MFRAIMRSFSTLGGNTLARHSDSRGFYNLTVRQVSDEQPQTQILHRPESSVEQDSSIQIIMPPAAPEETDLDAVRTQDYPFFNEEIGPHRSMLHGKTTIQGSDGRERALTEADYLCPQNVLKIEGEHHENIRLYLLKYGHINIAIDPNANYSCSSDVFEKSILNFEILSEAFAYAHHRSPREYILESLPIEYIYRLTNFSTIKEFKLLKNQISKMEKSVKDGFIIDGIYHRKTPFNADDMMAYSNYKPLLDAFLKLAKKKVVLLKKEVQEKKHKQDIDKKAKVDESTKFENEKSTFLETENQKIIKLTDLISRNLDKIRQIKVNIRRDILNDDLVALFKEDHDTALNGS